QFLHMPWPGLKQTFYGEWHIEFHLSDLPTGPREISAWVFDFKRQSVARMAGVFRVDSNKMTVERLEKIEESKIKR
ncbi:MAG: hypothetical protein K8R87_14280, partial [Verrucomicrobia bacterium]|nr:hypothetical protein [Verrucomicrobiota bacterium]